jgi:Carbohydrate binding domain
LRRHTRTIVAGWAMTFGLAVALLAVFSWPEGPRQGRNIVLNGGFEEGTAPWSTTEAAVLRRSTTVARFGRASASLTGRSHDPYGLYLLGAVDRPLGGDRYTVSAWIKGSPAAVGGRVAMQLTEHAGALPDQPVVVDRAAVKDSWIRLTGTGTVARRDRAALDLFVVVQRPHAAGETVYVDGISLRKLDSSRAAEGGRASSS